MARRLPHLSYLLVDQNVQPGIFVQQPNGPGVIRPFFYPRMQVSQLHPLGADIDLYTPPTLLTKSKPEPGDVVMEILKVSPVSDFERHGVCFNNFVAEPPSMTASQMLMGIGFSGVKPKVSHIVSLLSLVDEWNQTMETFVSTNADFQVVHNAQARNTLIDIAIRKAERSTHNGSGAAGWDLTHALFDDPHMIPEILQPRGVVFDTTSFTNKTSLRTSGNLNGQYNEHIDGSSGLSMFLVATPYQNNVKLSLIMANSLSEIFDGIHDDMVDGDNYAVLKIGSFRPQDYLKFHTNVNGFWFKGQAGDQHFAARVSKVFMDDQATTLDSYTGGKTGTLAADLYKINTLQHM